jgi:DNA-binding NarL/FixJ family response regulator
MSIAVLLVDDHAILRDSLQVLLEAQPDLKVAGTAANGREAVETALRLRPDVVVMDINMPLFNGIEAAGRILEKLPGTGIVILSMHGSREHIHRALQTGARGFLLKESAGTELVAAVRAVHAGRRYLSERAAEMMIDDYVSGRPGASPLERLSARERQILKLVVGGHTNADTARLVSLSVKTVESYRARLMRKLGVKDLPALVRFAIEHGLD